MESCSMKSMTYIQHVYNEYIAGEILKKIFFGTRNTAGKMSSLFHTLLEFRIISGNNNQGVSFCYS